MVFIKHNSHWSYSNQSIKGNINQISKRGRGINLGQNIGFSNDFLDMTPKAQVTKEKKTNWTS